MDPRERDFARAAVQMARQIRSLEQRVVGLQGEILAQRAAINELTQALRERVGDPPEHLPLVAALALDGTETTWLR